MVIWLQYVGIVGASSTILGIMATKTMNKSGYNVPLAAGTITAGGAIRLIFEGGSAGWDLKDIYDGMMQFMVIQVIGLILIIIFPQITLWLPRYLYPTP